jgi:hypothetical protein
MILLAKMTRWFEVRHEGRTALLQAGRDKQRSHYFGQLSSELTWGCLIWSLTIGKFCGQS